ncbi:11373_t:CDS:2, partial [Acaulospora colombiana]
ISTLEKPGPVLVEKIIDYKYEMDQDYYKLKFKDRNKTPQWQRYRNLFGVDEMIKSYWKREKLAKDSTAGPFGNSGRLLENTEVNNIRVAERNDATEANNFLFEKEKSPIIPISGKIKTPLNAQVKQKKFISSLPSESVDLWIENFLPRPYAEEIISLQNSIFVIEPSTENSQALVSYKNLMEWNDAVGVIKMDEENTYWLIFPNATKFGLSMQTQHLSNQSLVAVHKVILASKPDIPDPTKLQPTAIIESDQKLSSSHVFLKSMGYNKLLELCVNKPPKFIDFSPDDNFERKEILKFLECIGAQQSDYGEDVEMVLVHILYENQINYMPNLSRLKDLPSCKFILYGVDFRLKESSDIEEQTQQFHNSKWEIVLNQYVKEYLTQISNTQNVYSLKYVTLFT